MRAMPGGPGYLNASSCHIDMLPTEILCMIFDIFSRLTPSCRGQIAPIILLSHISRHWRRVALSAPSLWDRLDIYNIRQPQVLRDFLSRSSQRGLCIRIDIPHTIFWSGDDIPEFDETCRALAEHLPRICHLSITARNLTLRRLTDKVLVSVALPHLQHLELVSCNDSALTVLGPFTFDARVFTSIRLERTMIQVKDGRCLSGLQKVVLAWAPLTYLDQRRIPSITYPAAPTNWYTDIPQPSLYRLAELQIHAPLLHPVPGRTQPIILNAQGLPIPPPPFAPSFRADVLRSVILSFLSLSKVAYQAEPNVDTLSRLFRIIALAELTELHLISMSDQAVDGFLHSMTAHHCRFSKLRTLKLTAVPTERIFQYWEVTMGLDNFTSLFANAFPLLSDVSLAKLDPAPLVEILDRATVWPKLRTVEHDGKELYVRLPERLRIDYGT